MQLERKEKLRLTELDKLKLQPGPKTANIAAEVTQKTKTNAQLMEKPALTAPKRSTLNQCAWPRGIK